MAGALGAAPAEVDKQPDDEICDTDDVLIDHYAIFGHFTDDEAIGIELNTCPQEVVISLSPRFDGGQYGGHIGFFLDSDIVDAEELIAGVDEGVIGWTASTDVDGLDATATIHPNYPIIGEVKLAISVEIQDSADTCG